MPAEIWQPQIEYFSRNYHVVALDPRSQGASDKPAEGNYPGRRAQDYKELIDHLGSSPVVLVGWSLAVHEAMTYVEMFGTYKLSALVLVDMRVYDPSSAEERDRRYDMFHNFQADRKQLRGDLCPRDVSQAALGGISRERDHSFAEDADQLGDRHAGRTCGEERPPRRAAKIKIPVLAVMTEANRSQAELITATVPGSQAEVFEDAGHCLFVDDADRFNTLLASFLAKPLSKK